MLAIEVKTVRAGLDVDSRDGDAEAFEEDADLSERPLYVADFRTLVEIGAGEIRLAHACSSLV